MTPVVIEAHEGNLRYLQVILTNKTHANYTINNNEFPCLT